MYSAISGMKNFQLKLDVIGNNIANVNTYGYKKNRAVFKDMVYQAQGGASAPVQGGKGGTNPKQVGLGSQVATIDSVATQGSSQSTGRPLDLMINGDGYFMVSDGITDYYTRSGNFYLDQEGNIVNGDGMYLKGYGYNRLPDGTFEDANRQAVDSLGYRINENGNYLAVNPANPDGAPLQVNADGYRVNNDGKLVHTDGRLIDELGYLVNVDGQYLNAGGQVAQNKDDRIYLGKPVKLARIAGDKAPLDRFTIDPNNTKSFSIGPDGKINIVTATEGLDSSQQVFIAKFNNAEGLQRLGSSLYVVSSNSGAPIIGEPGLDGNGDIISSTLEMSNVDLGEEFTEMIVAQRAFQANTRTITTADQILQELMQMKR